jgi:hypothetical protein
MFVHPQWRLQQHEYMQLMENYMHVLFNSMNKMRWQPYILLFCYDAMEGHIYDSNNSNFLWVDITLRVGSRRESLLMSRSQRCREARDIRHVIREGNPSRHRAGGGRDFPTSFCRFPLFLVVDRGTRSCYGGWWGTLNLTSDLACYDGIFSWR